MRAPTPGLRQHADFRKLWTGQTISMFGSQVSFIALPLTAILVLDATPAQMGLLSAIAALPSLFFGLLVGAWVDRVRRRPILILTDLGQAALVLIVPVAALFGVLRMELLYLVMFGSGTLGLFFGVACRSYLLALVGREHIVEGNARLQISRSAADVGGPGVAGVLIQIASAPAALVVDGISYVVSALCVSTISAHEPEPEPQTGENRALRQEIADGLRLVRRDAVLRPIAAGIAVLSLFNALLEAVWVLYVTRQLGISPGWLGFIFSGGSVGFLVGALLAERATRRFGLGPALIAGLVGIAAGDLLIPLAGGPLWVAVALLIAGEFLFGLGLPLFEVGQVSLRQTVTPDPFQGRMNATMDVLAAAAIPIGALLGGALGEVIDLRLTLLIAVAGELSAAFVLFFSPVRRLREAGPAA